jgi:LytS/YehU family sensor histidine kinase
LKSGIRHQAHHQNELFLHAYETLYFYSYQANPLYYLKYPLWLLIYGLVVLILWVAQRLQAMQTRRKQQLEETINSLQMRVIKSQMDPHFMFNVLNGLAHNVAIGNTTEAHDQIIRFSKLLRSMMSKGEKTDTTLEAELDFVKSYLELERFRFKDDFSFLLQVEPSVDLNTRIPRMLIQLLVENAIKHGLRNKSDNKRIMIKAETRNAITILIVEDNGIGRLAAKEYQREGGNGSKIMADMIRLNRKITGNTIRVTTTDLYDDEGRASGTRVEVEI